MAETTSPEPADQGMALAHLGNSTTYRVLQPLLLALLVTAFLAGPIAVLRQGDAAGRWAVAGWYVFGISLWTTLTTLWLYHPDRRQLARVQYRLAEVVALVFVARLLSWAITGELPQPSAWRDYLLSPSLLLDGTFLGYAILGLLAWERCVALGRIFSQLAMGIEEARYYQQPRSVRLKDNFNPFMADRAIQVGQFFQNWLLMGVILGICAALTTFQVSELMRSFRNLTRLGLPSGLLLAMVAYFLIGLWLLSQARVSHLYARWAASDVETEAGIIRQWNRVSGGLLLIIALAASLLPIGSTFALSRLLQAVIGYVAWLLSAFMALLLALFVALLSPLLGAERAAEMLPESQPQPAAPPPVLPPGPGSEEAALVFGGLFWVVVIVVVIVAVAFVLRERNVNVGASWLRLAWARLLEWWAALRQGIGEQMEDWRVMAGIGRERKADQEQTSAPPWRFVRIRGLPPREQIRFFYLSAVRRAGEQGVPRTEAETPLEFATDLKTNWPEAEVEVDELTTAFLEARYSRHRIDDEDVGPIKRTWRRMRSNLRRRRRVEEGGEDQRGEEGEVGR